MRTLIIRAASFVPPIGLALATAVLPDTPPKAAPAVSIADYAFKPGTLTVHVGDTVGFANKDDETHTATAMDGTFDSGRLDPKAMFSYTFAKAGTYRYHCRIHSSMKGTIVVKPAESRS
jgi:plastocyanin